MTTTQELQDMLDAATPGPWIWEYWDGDPDNICRITHLKRRNTLVTAESVADEVEEPANARLMAQAPDLAAEVIRLREGIEAMAGEVQGVADGDMFMSPAGIANRLGPHPAATHKEGA